MKTNNSPVRNFLFLVSVFASLFIAQYSSTHAEDGMSNNALYKCEGIEERAVYSTFGVGMYQGEDGWFFRKGDLETLFDIPENTVVFLRNVKESLRYRNVHLIIIPMVPRGIVAGDRLLNGGVLADILYDPEFAENQFGDFIESLQAEGLDVINVADVIRDKVDFDRAKYYFKRDIHWTPEGAKIVANAVGEHIAKLDLISSKPLEFETSVDSEPRLHRANFNTILNELCQSKIPPELVNVYETKQKLDALDDLLMDDDAATAEVHVVGSSYTDDANVYNFTGFLRQYIKQDVGGFSVSGGGVDQSIYAWAQNPNGLEKKPRILIWEFADLVDMRKLSTVMNSTIVPSIIGDCGGELKLVDQTFDRSTTVNTELPSLPGRPADYYLQYTFTDKTLVGFNLSYDYADGSTKKVSFKNPTRVAGLGKFYQALPDGGESTLKNVHLTFDKEAVSSGSVKLCRYPPGVIQGETTSN